MRHMKISMGRSALTVILSSLLVVACGDMAMPPEEEQPTAVESQSPSQEQQPSQESASQTENNNAATATKELPDSGSGFAGNQLDDPNSRLFTKVVYFAFDSSVIESASQPIIEAHAQYLSSNPGATMALEGHADERGTREYNIALGERRANSVQRLMLLLGASQNQVSTISYGEERPVDSGHNEAAWSANRRVEFNYTSR